MSLNNLRQHLYALEGIISLLAESEDLEIREAYKETAEEKLAEIHLLCAELLKSSGEYSQITEHNSTQGAILLVDNDAASQFFTRKVLEKAGFTVRSASNSETALELGYKEQFDLILMDCQLPHIDGFEVTQRLLSYFQQKHITTPIVAYTFHSIPGYRQLCHQVGMKEYIKKPVNSSELVEKIHELIRK